MSNVTALDLSARQVALVKSTIAKDCTSDEFNLFMEAAKAYGLDPFRHQILPLVFSKGNAERRRMSIIVSRDGLRVIAARCKDYRPASEKAEWDQSDEAISPTNPKGLISCTVYLWKQDNRGEWYKVKGEAEWNEFAPITDEWAENENGKRRPTGNKVLDGSGNWRRMPKLMLEKCAEAQALRAGWPEQFSGVYVEEEMDRAAVLDRNASDIADFHAEERRLIAASAHNSIMVTWGDGWELQQVPLGQFADRVVDFIGKSDADTVARWADANRAPLREFWARQPGDALELKKIIEAKTADAEKVAA